MYMALSFSKYSSGLWTFLICSFRRYLSTYFLLHVLHWYSSSFVCHIFSCLSAPILLPNVFSQYLHLKVFCDWWTSFMCLLWLLFWMNLLSQNVHSYGFLPVWIRSWLSKLIFDEKVFGQKEQLYGFSPVWDLMCFSKLVLYGNILLHKGHLMLFSCRCRYQWAFK